jgi:hypothetical protein
LIPYECSRVKPSGPGFVILYARIVAELEERKAERLHRDQGRAAADPTNRGCSTARPAVAATGTVIAARKPP